MDGLTDGSDIFEDIFHLLLMQLFSRCYFLRIPPTLEVKVIQPTNKGPTSHTRLKQEKDLLDSRSSFTLKADFSYTYLMLLVLSKNRK